MDGLVEEEDLSSLSLVSILHHSILIPFTSSSSTRNVFSVLTLALILPLSAAILLHSFLLLRLLVPLSSPPYLLPLLFYHLLYLLFLFLLSLLATSSLVFSVASLYSSKPLSLSSALSSLPSILPRLLRTFLFFSLLLLLYNLLSLLFLSALLLLFPDPDTDSFLFLLSCLALLALLFLAHAYISALWHLASVVSVLEPLQGLAAMLKARDLLKGKTCQALVLIVAYLGACGVTGSLFRDLIVGDDDGGGAEKGGNMGSGLSVGFKVFAGIVLILLLMLVNLVGLVVQSVFYYVCKSYHRQEVDRRVLHDHLGGHLGEYVPLQSSVQMENL